MGALMLASDPALLAALPGLPAEQLADLAGAIASVSTAIESYCRRPLALTTFDNLYRPGRTRKIYLETKPVAVINFVRTDLMVALTITQTDVITNSDAWVSRTPAGVMTLSRVASGVQTDVPITLASYATFGALATAVNAVGSGWSAQVQSYSTNGSNPSTTALSALNNDFEPQGALEQAAELRVYQRFVNRYHCRYDRGEIELTENRPEAFRFPDKAYGVGFGWSWSAAAEPRHAGVRIGWRGGYAVQPSDLALGYAPVPDDLKRAVILGVQACLNITPAPQVQSGEDGAVKFDYGGAPVVLPSSVTRLLATYVNKRLFLTK